VRTGERPFDHVYGPRVWEYYAANPDEGARFDAAMAAITGRLAEAVVSSYDFSRYGRVVDVGGGDGTLLAAILRSAPSARGVLFDVPAVVDRAQPALESAGVLDRTELVGGDFRRRTVGCGLLRACCPPLSVPTTAPFRMPTRIGQRGRRCSAWWRRGRHGAAGRLVGARSVVVTVAPGCGRASTRQVGDLSRARPVRAGPEAGHG
jgi:hypothetical protein